MDKTDTVVICLVIFFCALALDGCALALYCRATDIWKTLKEILEELRKHK